MSGKASRQGVARPQAELQEICGPGQSVELLKELHILTREGRLNQDSRRKLKQVYHLFQFIEKLLLELPEAGAHATLADHGAGKSYLGFILYDLFFKAARRRPRVRHRDAGRAGRQVARAGAAAGLRAHVLPEPQRGRGGRRGRAAGADRRRDRAACLRHRHRRRDRLRPAPSRRASWCWCLAARPRWRPACAQTKALALSRTPLAELWRHPLHTREIGSQLTNVLRCLYLEAHGYQVTVTELVGWEHSLKNELIIARRTGQRKAQRRRPAARTAGPVRAGGAARRRAFASADARHGPPSPSHAGRAAAPRHPARQQPPGDLRRPNADHETAARACWARTRARFGIALHAYVLMSNHFHLLATPATRGRAAAVDAGRGPALRALLQRPARAHRHLVGGPLQVHADPDRPLPAGLHGLHRPEPGARRHGGGGRATTRGPATPTTPGCGTTGC